MGNKVKHYPKVDDKRIIWLMDITDVQQKWIPKCATEMLSATLSLRE